MKKFSIMFSAVPAFRDVIDVPLVVRRLHKSRSEVCISCWRVVFYKFNPLLAFYVSSIIFMYQVRKELGIADDIKVVIFNFGGQVSEDIVFSYM